MIQLTKLNQTPISLNAIDYAVHPKLVQTVLTLLSGKKVHVLETVEEVTNKITTYHQKINLLSSLQEPNWTE